MPWTSRCDHVIAITHVHGPQFTPNHASRAGNLAFFSDVGTFFSGSRITGSNQPRDVVAGTDNTLDHHRKNAIPGEEYSGLTWTTCEMRNQACRSPMSRYVFVNPCLVCFYAHPIATDWTPHAGCQSSRGMSRTDGVEDIDFAIEVRDEFEPNRALSRTTLHQGMNAVLWRGKNRAGPL